MLARFAEESDRVAFPEVRYPEFFGNKVGVDRFGCGLAEQFFDEFEHIASNLPEMGVSVYAKREEALHAYDFPGCLCRFVGRNRAGSDKIGVFVFKGGAERLECFCSEGDVIPDTAVFSDGRPAAYPIVSCTGVFGKVECGAGGPRGTEHEYECVPVQEGAQRGVEAESCFRGVAA